MVITDTSDLVNGLFEACGAISVLNHTRVLWRSRQAHGVSVLSILFFTAWGGWNLFFYPHLGQWLSFCGGLAIMVSEIVWFGSVVWLRWFVNSAGGVNASSATV
jgi:hypothetical protein